MENLSQIIMSNQPGSVITYTDTNIDKIGLKYTMDGGADGHTLNSSVDEIIHNLIDMQASYIKIYSLEEKYWSFNFNICKEVDNPHEMLKNGVSLYNTKGRVGTSDISKYGKGIKCAAHCIYPEGKMILGLVADGGLHMAVYNQGKVQSILPNTPASSKIEELYLDEFPEINNNTGFIILVDDPDDYYDIIFSEYRQYYEDSYEDQEIDKGLINHIRICYSPYLDTNFECDGDVSYHNIEITINDEVIDSFSHTRYSSEDIEDNSEIEYAKEYLCIVPYREINGKKKYDLDCMFFKEENHQFTFNKNNKNFPPNFDNEGLDGDNIIVCTIRFTKLATMAQKLYNDMFPNSEKTRNCSYFVYRNGVCSDTSFISFEGNFGFRPTDCPQMRAEIHMNNSFDEIIRPGSNKSLIRPDEKFTCKLRALSKYVQKDVFKKKEKSRLEFLEGKKYLVKPNNEVMDINGEKKLGQIKGGQVRWDKLIPFKAKKKKELMDLNNNTTPILSEKIDNHNDIKDKKYSDFRLFTPNPETDGDDIHIISNAEYELIESGIIAGSILEDCDELKEKQKEINLKRLKTLIESIQTNFDIINYQTGNKIDLSHISIDHKV